MTRTQPNWPRKAGSTTKMLNAAVRSLMDGQSVCVVVPTKHEIDRVRGQASHALLKAGAHHGAASNSLYLTGPRSGTMTFRSAYDVQLDHVMSGSFVPTFLEDRTADITYVDHRVYELAIDSLMEAWSLTCEGKGRARRLRHGGVTGPATSAGGSSR